ncbi:MAG: hypothetical protein NTY64_07460 [Deltaproteobacteria bacterium]|nr:hypothetical protein [Deltaproteobacteria bacterium]
MIYGLYEKMEEYIPVLFFLLIFTLMVVQVFTRYVIHFSLAWNIELCRSSRGYPGEEKRCLHQA